MKRRQVLTGLGGVLATTGFAVGSGAFSSVDADRMVTIDVEDDPNAFLRLTERGTGQRSSKDGGMLTFDLPSPDDNDYPSGAPTDPEGLGSNSVYRFGHDAAGDEAGLFGIQNLGTQPVVLYSRQSTTAGVPTLGIYDVENPSGCILTESTPSAPVPVGDELYCGLEVDTGGVAPQSDAYDVELTIVAMDPNEFA